jgi:DivIVA domain-containing protein
VDRASPLGRATIGIMATLLLVLVVVLVIAGLVFGVVSILSGDDPVLVPAEPDGRARPLPHDRSLQELDLREVRFDVALRGYRMAQVDLMLRRTAYDLGYKDEMIAVLEAEVAALREGRSADAETLREAREAAAGPLTPSSAVPPEAPDDEAADDSADWADTETEPDQDDTDPEADAAESDEATADAGDPTEQAEQELPREGSLRRRPAHA